MTDEECPICLEVGELGKMMYLSCAHRCHVDCLVEMWATDLPRASHDEFGNVAVDPKCPVCRTQQLELGTRVHTKIEEKRQEKRKRSRNEIVNDTIATTTMPFIAPRPVLRFLRADILTLISSNERTVPLQPPQIAYEEAKSIHKWIKKLADECHLRNRIPQTGPVNTTATIVTKPHPFGSFTLTVRTIPSASYDALLQLIIPEWAIVYQAYRGNGTWDIVIESK